MLLRRMWLLRASVAVLITSASIAMPRPVVAGLFSPSDFGDCILDRMPGTANDIAAGQIYAACVEKFPRAADDIKKETGTFAKYKNGRECVIANAKNTSSPIAAKVITSVCFAKYEPEPVFDLDKIR